MNRNLTARAACLLAFLALLSCDPDRVFEENTRIPGRKWDKDLPVVFQARLDDTINVHNIHVNIRNSNGYGFSNLFLFITSSAPNGASVRDTLECILANTRGKWYGKGMGNVYYLRVPYKKSILFPSAGTYLFEVQHGMRSEELEGILDIGLRIERSSQSRK